MKDRPIAGNVALDLPLNRSAWEPLDLSEGPGPGDLPDSAGDETLDRYLAAMRGPDLRTPEQREIDALNEDLRALNDHQAPEPENEAQRQAEDLISDNAVQMFEDFRDGR